MRRGALQLPTVPAGHGSPHQLHGLQLQSQCVDDPQSGVVVLWETANTLHLPEVPQEPFQGYES